MENCLFDLPTYSVNKKIRLIELFGGIGSQAMALRGKQKGQSARKRKRYTDNYGGGR